MNMTISLNQSLEITLAAFTVAKQKLLGAAAVLDGVTVSSMF